MDFAFGVVVGGIIILYLLAPTIQDQREEIAGFRKSRDEQETMDQRFMEASNKIFQRRLRT
jgi:hypothetical protein